MTGRIDEDEDGLNPQQGRQGVDQVGQWRQGVDQVGQGRQGVDQVGQGRPGGSYRESVCLCACESVCCFVYAFVCV